MTADRPEGRAALALERVTLDYGDVRALDDISLVIPRGERVCVLGANGSGKSTLASVIAGLLAPDSGIVRIAGRTVRTDEGGADFAAYAAARKRVGLVFQSPDDQIVTTVVEEDVAFGPENLCVAPDEIGQRVEEELRRVAMGAYATTDPTTLSGGQKQRVAIAGALAMRPQILVLDEPGSLLDMRGRRGIMRVMEELRSSGITIVHVTHFMDEALAADRAIVLASGRIVAEGTPKEVFRKIEHDGMYGLELPFAARVANTLRTRGVALPPICDEHELVRALAEGARKGGRGTRTSSEVRTDERTPCPVPGDLRAAQPTPSLPRAIEARDVGFSYADGDGHGGHALSDVSFDIEDGSHVAIVGHTGSGKSTLLRLLCGLDAPDAGHLRVLGINTTRRRDRRSLHGRVGYVMQHPERQLFAESVFDDVAFGPTNLGLGADEVRRRVNDALRLVGLEGKGSASPFQLSGGQQRLCAIAGILAMETRLLILDEPTAGLDPWGRGRLREVLNEVRTRGTTIIEVTHAMDDAALADQVIVLSRGTVLLDGSPGETFCPAHAGLLRAHGLGLPSACVLAHRLEEAGLAPLGHPLDIESLVDTVCACLHTRCVTDGPGPVGPPERTPWTGPHGSNAACGSRGDARQEDAGGASPRGGA